MASEKIAQLIEEVKVLSVLELSELVHALELSLIHISAGLIACEEEEG